MTYNPETCFKGYVRNEMKLKKVILLDLFTMKNVETSCMNVCLSASEYFPL